MFGFGKNSRKNSLIKKFKKNVDYISQGYHLKDSNSMNLYKQQSKISNDILGEFSIFTNIDINSQKEELKNMFDYMNKFDHLVQRGGIKYGVAIASEISVRKFKKNSDPEVVSAIVDVYPEYHHYVRNINDK